MIVKISVAHAGGGTQRARHLSLWHRNLSRPAEFFKRNAWAHRAYLDPERCGNPLMARKKSKVEIHLNLQRAISDGIYGEG
jgi:hypothetical protein